MAKSSVGETFAFIILVGYLAFNEVHTTQQKARIRRDEDYIVDDCPKNDTFDLVHGFPQLSTDNYTVQFIVENGEHSINIAWKTPIGRNNSVPDGYWIIWDVYDTQTACQVLSGEVTSFAIHESSSLWSKDDYIVIFIKPLPSKFKGFWPIGIELPLFTPPFNDEDGKITEGTISIQDSKEETLETARGFLNQEKETLTIVSITTAAVVATLLIAFVVVSRYRKKKLQPCPEVPRDAGYIYVSYVQENENHVKKVVDFTSYFRKQGYDLQMDLMLTPNRQQDLKELGRLRWSEKQLLNARNVFMIISPSYLHLCRLGESSTNGSTLTEDEKMVLNEIIQIRNELSSKAYISSRFIPVLFGVKEMELPFWIKQLVVYTWPNDKLNNKLLYRISEEVFYEYDNISESVSNDNTG